MKRVCVFCGSRTGNRPLYHESTRRLGSLLGQHGLGLVFGAGHIGLMGVLADAALAAGAEVIGVIPQALEDKELAHRGLTQLHVVESMHERKALMANLADAFIALPGGYGTCDELFEILTWRQLKLHDKPIGLLNAGGFFDGLMTWLDQMVQEDFVQPKNRGLLFSAEEPEVLLRKLLVIV